MAMPPPRLAWRPEARCPRPPPRPRPRKLGPLVLIPSSPGGTGGGRFAAGNDERLTTGLQSTHLARAHAPLRQETVAEILRDRGYADSDIPPKAYRLLVENLAGSALILEHIETFLTDSGGPISGKGRTKRALTAYLQVLDRVMRLAAAVGVDRISRPTYTSTRAWLEEVADQQPSTGPATPGTPGPGQSRSQWEAGEESTDDGGRTTTTSTDAPTEPGAQEQD